jgi:hypothetical protein
LNVSADGASAIMAVAVIEPTLGIVIKWRAIGSSLGRRLISRSRAAMFSSRDFRVVINTLKMIRSPSGSWQLRKLAVTMHAMLKSGEMFNRTGGSAS